LIEANFVEWSQWR